ncbi:MAG TPA: acyltransferase family protein [Arenimonas sp.]|nr:acyltransferase family protein [Arenimonas sp.]
MNATQERLHYMDHLRALAMLAGVFFHAALAFSPLMQGFFPTADRQNSAWVDVVAWGLHLFRMPLFFVVAGFFAAWVIERRGGAAFARQRVRRIALPFLVAWPLVWLSLSAAVVWAVENVRHPSAFLAMVDAWMRMDDPPQAPLGTSHLWFLYYLLLLAVLQWVARTLDLGRALRGVLTRHPAWLLLGLPVLLVPALASVSAPHPAPEGLLPQFWALLFYGAFYALGTQLHAAPGWLERVRPCVPWLVAGGAVLYALFLWRLSVELPGATQPTASWPVAALEALLSVWLTVLCLVAGQRLLNRASAPMRYLAQSAYWTYLWHLPLLFALQFALMDSDMAWPLKFALASGATLAVCLLSYQLLVRHTPLRRFVG